MQRWRAIDTPHDCDGPPIHRQNCSTDAPAGAVGSRLTPPACGFYVSGARPVDIGGYTARWYCGLRGRLHARVERLDGFASLVSLQREIEAAITEAAEAGLACACRDWRCSCGSARADVASDLDRPTAREVLAELRRRSVALDLAGEPSPEVDAEIDRLTDEVLLDGLRACGAAAAAHELDFPTPPPTELRCPVCGGPVKWHAGETTGRAICEGGLDATVRGDAGSTPCPWRGSRVVRTESGIGWPPGGPDLEVYGTPATPAPSARAPEATYEPHPGDPLARVRWIRDAHEVG